MVLAFFLLNFYSLKAKDREEIGLVKQEPSKSVESLWTQTVRLRTFQQPKAVGDALGPTWPPAMVVLSHIYGIYADF